MTEEGKPAPPPMRSPEKLALCTIRIESETNAGEGAVGTGFFFRFTSQDGQSIPLVITNLHVVKDMRRVVLRFTRTGKDGKPAIGNIATCDDSEFGANWIPHPDPEVDLCALPIAKLLMTARQRGVELWATSIDRSFIPSPEENALLTALEEVVMVGYPTGLFDSVNNMPILRKGVAATHPRDDYEGKKEFLIDIACFEGSSGSPVFLWGAPIVEIPNTILTGGVSTRGLLGILYGAAMWTAEGKIDIGTIPTRAEPVAKTRIPINLGVVIRAERLLDFEPIVSGQLAHQTPS